MDMSTAPAEVLQVVPSNVEAVRSFWHQLEQQKGAQPPAPKPPLRPRMLPLKVDTIKEVRLRRVDRSKRDSENVLGSRLLLRTCSSSSVSSTQMVTPAAAQPAWVPGLGDLDEGLLHKVLHMASASIRAGVGGCAVAVRQWTSLALVCRRWREQMLAQPVAVHVGAERWPAVQQWLASTRVPVASLQLAAVDGRASQQLGRLLCSPHFQQLSGHYLRRAEMAFGFRYAAGPTAWPVLTSLGDLIGLPSQPLPATLTKLTLWTPEPPHPSAMKPHLGPALLHLTKLKCLWLRGWVLKRADLPDSLQVLKLQECTVLDDIATWPPPLNRAIEAGAAPRGSTPRDPFMPIGGGHQRRGSSRRPHSLICDPTCDRRLLTAFLRPPLRRWHFD